MKRTPSLLACVLFDLIGYASYSIPVLGEFTDLIWAPISALLFFIMFRGWKGAFGGLFNFVEELMPGLDFIPTFTLTWIWQYFSREKVDERSSAMYIDPKGSYHVTNR